MPDLIVWYPIPTMGIVIVLSIIYFSAIRYVEIRYKKVQKQTPGGIKIE